MLMVITIDPIQEVFQDTRYISNDDFCVLHPV